MTKSNQKYHFIYDNDIVKTGTLKEIEDFLNNIDDIDFNEIDNYQWSLYTIEGTKILANIQQIPVKVKLKIKTNGK